MTTGGRKRSTRLLEAIERAGATPHILVPHRLLPEDERPARAEAQARGWCLEDIPYPSGTAVTRLRQHIRQEMNRYSPLLVARLHELGRTAAVTQFEEIGTMQYVTSAPRHIPSVISPHNVDSAVEAAVGRELPGHLAHLRSRYRARRLLLTERRAARRADLVVCVSPQDRRHFESLGAHEAMVVPNGVDDELFALPAEPSTSLRVLFFGSYLWPANAAGLTRYVREVWPRVVAEEPLAELRVAGPGPVEAVQQAASATRRVTILGFVPDLLAELHRARLVVAPIWFGGGTRIKVLEAMAAARPVVGTTIGVERIGFEHGCHGLVADEPEGLVAATLRVLRDDEAARCYGRNGRTLAESYRWRTVTSRLEERYRSLFESGARLGASIIDPPARHRVPASEPRGT